MIGQGQPRKKLGYFTSKAVNKSLKEAGIPRKIIIFVKSVYSSVRETEN